jgi:hypothetical protein
MTGPDASYGEMHGFPFPGRPGHDRDEPALDDILDGRSVPPDSPQELHPLAEMLASLAGPAEPGDLAGEAATLTAFTRTVSPARISPAARRPARQRSAGPPRPRRPGLAASLALAAALLGGTAAAYADVLPAPAQEVAHVTFGAPAPYGHDARPAARRPHARPEHPGQAPAPGAGGRTRATQKHGDGPQAGPSARAGGAGRTGPGKPAGKEQRIPHGRPGNRHRKHYLGGSGRGRSLARQAGRGQPAARQAGRAQQWARQASGGAASASPRQALGRPGSRARMTTAARPGAAGRRQR